MTHDLKPYPAYKDSGVPWLGEVPEHWWLFRTKHVLRERSQKGFPDEPLLAATQSKGVVRKESYENRTVLALKDLHLLKLVRSGDFVISLRSFQGGIEYAHEQGIISPAYTVLYPTDASTHGFLAWLFKSKPYIDNLTLHVTGIRQGQNIDYDRLRRSDLPLPPPAEQSAIVRLLDHIDRRIRRYIRAKRRLIALLNEQKQVLIHHAVTRGLDPNVRLKPSGVECLGEVPEHWTIVPLKSTSVIQSGLTLGKNYIGHKLSEFPYLRVANVQVGHLDLTTIKTVFVPKEEASRTSLRIGDVLMTEGGDPDKLGRGCVWEGQVDRCLHQNHIFAVRPSAHRLLPRFLEALLRSRYAQIYFLRRAKQTTNLASTNRTTIGNLPILLPGLEVQRAILRVLERQTSHLSQAIANIESGIDLIRQYRTRLITDVVTGKLDVREAAARLPEEPAGPVEADLSAAEEVAIEDTAERASLAAAMVDFNA